MELTLRTLAGNALDRYWHWIRELPPANPTLRRQRRIRGALRFESLETRRVMYGADFLDLGEGESGSLVEDFSLIDVNPNSDTFNQSVSPRDSLQHASAWYFGHST